MGNIQKNASSCGRKHFLLEKSDVLEYTEEKMREVKQNGV